MRLNYFFTFIAFVIFLPLSIAAPTVNLTFPEDMNISDSNSPTFRCHVNDTNNISTISFYSDISGVFSLNSTQRLTGIEMDPNTTMLCHFDNNYTCETGQESTSTAYFVPGKSLQGVMVNESETLQYPIGNAINLERGTVEMWIRIEFSPLNKEVWFLDTGTENENEIELYMTDDRTLHFVVWDDDGSNPRSEADINFWNPGEWHYIAATWSINTLVDRGHLTALYIDGIPSVDSYDENGIGIVGPMNGYLTIGRDYYGNMQADSVFDEFRIYDRPRTDSEIQNSFNEGSSDHTNITANFSFTYVPDGTYHWNCLAQDNESQSWAASNFTFLVDAQSPPVVKNMSFSPNSLDDIDPGVTLNVTANITSISNISSVIFQYKYDVDWINLTMTNSSADIWNASFVTNSEERIYEYRIFANDTQGHSNTTGTQSLNVTKDYTWTANISNSTAQGFIDNTSFVGILEINNTGDDTLAITLTDNWPIIDIYYNTTNSFSIPAKTSRYVNITAKFASFDSSSIMTINISAQPTAPMKTASPLSRSISVNMITYSGGPYISITAENIPSQANQSQYINLSSVIMNIGNETADNVTLKWILPSGWVNTTGGTETLFGSINPLASNRSNITVFVDSSSESGISTICVNVTRDPGINYTICQNVTIICTGNDGICGGGCSYVNDDDCLPPSGSGPGGSSVSAVDYSTSRQKYGIFLGNIPVIHGFRNENISFYVNVFSKENKTVVNNISLSIGGFMIGKMRITPAKLSNVTYEKGQEFLVEMDIPDYMQYGKYNISIMAFGKAGSTTYNERGVDVNASSLVMLFVHSISENSTIEAVRICNETVARMEGEGMNTNSLVALTVQAESSLENFDYTSAQELSEKITATAKIAYDTKTLLEELENKINISSKYGIETNQSKMLYALSAAAYRRGDYERAKERATGAILAYGIEVGDRITTAEFFEKNSMTMAIAAAFAIIVALLSMKLISASNRVRRLRLLESEELVLNTLMKSLQNRFFRNRSLGRGEFITMEDSYEKRYSSIKKERANLQFPGNSSGNIKKRLSHLNETMKNAQRDYYERGLIGKKLYEKIMEDSRTEISNINSKYSRRRWKIFPFAVIVIASLLSTGMVFADSANQTGFDWQHSSEALDSAESAMYNARNLGYDISRINDTIAESRMEMERGNYATSISLSLFAINLEKSAVSSDALLDQAEQRLQDCDTRGINTSRAWEYFRKGLESFDIGIYEDSENYFKKSLDSLDESENQMLMSRTYESAESGGLPFYIKQNQNIIAAALLMIAFSAVVIYFVTMNIRKSYRHDRLLLEKKALQEQLKSVQQDYFTLNNISKREYNSVLKRSSKRLGEIDRELIMMEKSSMFKQFGNLQ